MSQDYRTLHRQSLEAPDVFWLDAARAVDWVQEPSTALDSSAAPLHRWFPDGELNTSYNALDRHVEAGRGDSTALIYDSAMLGLVRQYTYSELRDEVACFAGVLRAQGVAKGDRVVIYLPMVPEALIAMLATARLGAIHSVVFGGFAAKELASRIQDARPTVVVTASGGLEPRGPIEYLPAVDEALSLGDHRVGAVIVKSRKGFVHQVSEYGSASDAHGSDTLGSDTRGSDTAWLDWDTELATAEPADPVPVLATDPLYILYTSGTTGSPKGVVRDNGGHAVALTWSIRNIFGIGPGDVMLTASDVGWVVGHSYIVYAPLLAGATTVLYEGKPVGTPDAGAFWRLINDHRINVLFTAPTALRAVRKVDPDAALLSGYDISSLRLLFCAGERLDIDTYRWAGKTLGVPVIDNWWQTETGWPICANPRGIQELPLKPGSPTLPQPGYNLVILDAGGQEVPVGTEGNIALRLPLPPGTLPTLWGSDERYISSYLSAFDGFYVTGDSGYVDDDGYVFVMGRTDDIINVAGHRLSTGAIEQVLAQHPAVAECAVIGLADPLKGQRASGYVVLKAGVHIDPAALEQELVALVRTQIGPVADFKQAMVVDGLPKTRSGKILRKTMRQMASGEDYVVPSTIEDQSVLDAMEPILRPDAAPSAPTIPEG
ncbi:AMP-binding protein [Arthrobacter sp. CAN_C5]|uniref:AMP-binding protein n=1 Tax=Arthrobacter sp. CAN_C5 TaxID=2760706 RepID=UPI001AE1D4DF|nr:AMP-binding protein [Arthrobacter sp. CAN_C5]MBP2217449.1 propionyl-CoA synthetase [Arthrobacter sp. CAN_C5]